MKYILLFYPWGLWTLFGPGFVGQRLADAQAFWLFIAAFLFTCWRLGGESFPETPLEQPKSKS